MVDVDGCSLPRTHRPSRLAWFEGWRPSGAQSAFIKWTGWTLAMALPWWQHHINVVIVWILVTVSGGSGTWCLVWEYPQWNAGDSTCSDLGSHPAVSLDLQRWPSTTPSIVNQTHTSPVSRDSHNVWVTSLTVPKQQTEQTHTGDNTHNMLNCNHETHALHYSFKAGKWQI